MNDKSILLNSYDYDSVKGEHAINGAQVDGNDWGSLDTNAITEIIEAPINTVFNDNWKVAQSPGYLIEPHTSRGVPAAKSDLGLGQWTVQPGKDHTNASRDTTCRKLLRVKRQQA